MVGLQTVKLMQHGLRINVWLECPGVGHTLTVFGTEDSTEIVNLLLRNNHFQLLHEMTMFHQATSDKYVQPEYDSGTTNSKDLPPAFHDHTYGLQHGFNQSKTLDSTNINPFLNEHSYSRQENNTPPSVRDHSMTTCIVGNRDQ